MRAYLLRRLLLAVPTVFGVITVVFLLLHLVPGDPVDVMLGEGAQAADKLRLRRELGLDEPLPVQYVHYLERLAHLDLGRSLHSDRAVSRLIARRYPATLELAASALIVAVCVGLPLGLLAAARPRSPADAACRGLAALAAALPNFWLGPLLLLAFAIALPWAPVSGRGGFAHLVLPAVTLGTGMAAVLLRLLRAMVLDHLQDDYIRTARGKGAGELRVLLAHAARNALLPLCTVLGLQAGALLAGAIITETIFSWPGIGRLTLLAIQTRDYPVVQGCILVVAVSYVLVNLCTDLLYGWLDPRVRLDT